MHFYISEAGSSLNNGTGLAFVLFSHPIYRLCLRWTCLIESVHVCRRWPSEEARPWPVRSGESMSLQPRRTLPSVADPRSGLSPQRHLHKSGTCRLTNTFYFTYPFLPLPYLPLPYPPFPQLPSLPSLPFSSFPFHTLPTLTYPTLP